METARIWIRNNPATGNQKPWEVCFQVENHQARVIASCTTEERATKSAKDAAKRNSKLYKVEV